eukprot:2288_1
MSTDEGNTPGNDLNSLYTVAFQSIQDAKMYKKCGKFKLAFDLYIKGIDCFLQITKKELNITKKKLIQQNLKLFITEAESLQQQIHTNKTNQHYTDPFDLDLPDPPISNEGIIINTTQTNTNNIFDKAQNQLDKAIEFDQQKQYTNAIKQYNIASQLFLNGLKTNTISLSKHEIIKYRNKLSIIIGRTELLTTLLQKQNNIETKYDDFIGYDSKTNNNHSSEYKQNININKKIESWNNNDVIQWINSIDNIPNKWYNIIINEIKNSECTGKDVASLKSPIEIGEAFGIEENKNLCDKIYKNMKQFKSKNSSDIKDCNGNKFNINIFSQNKCIKLNHKVTKKTKISYVKKK